MISGNKTGLRDTDIVLSENGINEYEYEILVKIAYKVADTNECNRGGNINNNNKNNRRERGNENAFVARGNGNKYNKFNKDFKKDRINNYIDKNKKEEYGGFHSLTLML